MANEKIATISAYKLFQWYTQPPLISFDNLFKYISEKKYTEIITLSDLHNELGLSSLIPEYCENFDDLATDSEKQLEEIDFKEDNNMKIQWM